MIKELYILWQYRRQVNGSGLYFFFPFYHIGGAETVHLKILAACEVKPNCFITNQSFSEANRQNFEKVSNLISFDDSVNKIKCRNILLKLLAAKINRHKTPVVFGCNSIFFYDLIPLLKDHVRIMDLTHAFSYEEYSPESYSLPFATRLDTRVVLGTKTKADYAELYQKNGINPIFTERIRIIKNAVEIPKAIIKSENKILQLIFVARNSPEKRPEIVFDILRKLNEINFPFHCRIIGDFPEGQELENTEFTGEIHDTNRLNDLYTKSDILLLTSEREGLPMVILEAMAHKVVPVSTSVGEIPELNSNLPGILLVDTGDQENVSAEMVKIICRLNENRRELQSRQENCFKFVKDNYSEDRFAENYRNLFHGQ